MNNRLMDRSKQPQTLELRETVALTALIRRCGQFLDLMSKDVRRKK